MSTSINIAEGVEAARFEDGVRMSLFEHLGEFGVLREGGQLKAYGTGLLSSAGELDAMRAAEPRPFDLEASSRTDYDPTRHQPVLFCADSFREMYPALKGYLSRWRG